MPELLQIAANTINAKLIGASRDTRLFASEVLSYEVEGSERSSAFKANTWDGRSSFFDFETGVFPAGFVQMMARELRRRGHQVQFALTQAPAPLGPPIGSFDPLGYGFVERYDYQVETINQLIKYRRMVARIATGGGKSNVALLAIVTLGLPSLFLTTRKSLMWQMHGHLLKAGIEAGVVGDGHWAPRRLVNVGMVQSLAARLSPLSDKASAAKIERHAQIQRATMGFLLHQQFLIGEEAHEVGGADYWTIAQLCRNAHYRLALTATPFMRADGEANMRLQGAFGSIGMEVSEKLLIERGILAKPYFKIVKTPRPLFLRRGTGWPTCYDLNIVENRERLAITIRELQRAKQHGLTAMVLVQRKKHGENHLEACREAGLNTEFIFGEDNEGERQAALGRLGRKETDVLIGTSILDVGVDVPSVGMVANAGGGKAEVTLRQRVGRGLREKKDGGPNVAFMIDFDDAGNKITQEHALQRRAILEATPGFSENILPAGVDFPYDLFRSRRIDTRAEI